VKKFEWVEHPSDIGFRAYGKNLAEAFENAALAFFEVMFDTGKVRTREEIKVELEAEDEKALLYDWLERFLYLRDAKGLVMSKFKVEELGRSNAGFKIKAKAWGEKFDPKRHEPKVAIKAVTYHLMEIKCEKNKCSVQAVVDI
jgi:SHS2 domain-containing protein